MTSSQRDADPNYPLPQMIAVWFLPVRRGVNSTIETATIWAHAAHSQRLKVLSLALLVLGALVSACASSDRPQDAVHVLTWDGEVNPVMERYLKRGLDSAADTHARAVVLRLDTPGGFDSSMRGIIKRMQASSVPVIVYVSPSGGRAASAGTFITLASHVAAMAPGTTIGAATPINASAMTSKATSDARCRTTPLPTSEVWRSHGRRRWAESGARRRRRRHRRSR